MFGQWLLLQGAAQVLISTYTLTCISPNMFMAARWYQKYGAFYADELQDALLAQRLLASAGIPRFESSMVLEGGSVHTDGQGCASRYDTECLAVQ